MDTLGKRIKHYRERRKLTQEKLAKKVRLTKTSISNIERDYQKPRNIALFAKALDITIDDLTKDILKDFEVSSNNIDIGDRKVENKLYIPSEHNIDLYDYYMEVYNAVVLEWIIPDSIIKDKNRERRFAAALASGDGKDRKMKMPDEFQKILEKFKATYLVETAQGSNTVKA